VWKAVSQLLLAVAITLAGSVQAQDAGTLLPPEQLRARVMPEQVKLGEPVTVEFTITHSPDQRYELKTPGDLGDFDYLGQERKRVDGPVTSTTTILVKLAAFQLGAQDTPKLQLEVSAPQGTMLIDAPTAKVNVVSTLPPDAQSKGEDLYDTKPPKELPIRSWRVLYALAAILGAALLAYGIYRFLNRPKKVEAAQEKPKDPLHVRAVSALDALAKENLPGRGEFKLYYFRLSEIVRGYLGELYKIEALESTTPELLAALRSRITPGLPVKEFTEFAEGSDFIRYAKLEPTPDECKLHLELAYRIIHSTHAAQPPPTP
jgi:hypothetical protein